MILVVDHDPQVLEAAARILNRDRQVFLASTAREAFEMVQNLGGFSVVLIELDLPGDANGLIRRLHDHHPELRIIAMSTATSPSVPTPTTVPDVVAVLKKPVTASWKPVVERLRTEGPSGDSGVHDPS